MATTSTRPVLGIGRGFVVPPHPTIRNWPAGLMAKWLDPDDPRWTNGPWKALHKTAEASGWLVRAYVARGFTSDSSGHVGPLTDSLSLRCWRNQAGTDDPADGMDRAVAMWTRPTWPVLGRGRPKGDDGGERQGEGRKTTEGRTWLWHPPMAAPDLVADEEKGTTKDPLLTKWTFFAGWTWTIGGPLTVATAAEVRTWLKRVPDRVSEMAE